MIRILLMLLALVALAPAGCGAQAATPSHHHSVAVHDAAWGHAAVPHHDDGGRCDEACCTACPVAPAPSAEFSIVRGHRPLTPPRSRDDRSRDSAFPHLAIRPPIAA